MPNTAWTVIPRGIKDNQLHLGIYVSALPADPTESAYALDGTKGTDIWTKWYSNRMNDLFAHGKKSGLKLLLNGETDPSKGYDVSILAPEHPSPSWATVWQQLVCYAQPEWEKKTFNAPLPSNENAAAELSHSQEYYAALERPGARGSTRAVHDRGRADGSRGSSTGSCCGGGAATREATCAEHLRLGGARRHGTGDQSIAFDEQSRRAGEGRFSGFSYALDVGTGARAASCQ